MHKLRVSFIISALLFAALTSAAPQSISTAAGAVPCGTLTLDPGTSFPTLETNNCPPDTATAPTHKPWQPLAIKAGTVCVDWILYHTDQVGAWNIYRLGELPDKPKADNNLSKGMGKGVVDMSPSRSPDGQWMAFTSNRSGNWELFVGSTDGVSQVRATYTTTAANLSPMWSPDGKSIAYDSTLMGGHNIYMFDVSKGTSTRLTTTAANDVNPYWSPASNKIIFQSDRSGSGQWQVYELDLASKKETRLSDGNGIDMDPQYSPDGKMIVFRSFRDGARSAIYIMNADGSGLKRISDALGTSLNPAWSPDSTLIAYQSDRDGDYDIYVYQVTSAITRRVTDNKVADYAPTWRCNEDTSFIVFTSEITGKPNIYQTSALPMNNRGVRPEDINQLTFDRGHNMYPENEPAVEFSSRQSEISISLPPPTQ